MERHAILINLLATLKLFTVDPISSLVSEAIDRISQRKFQPKNQTSRSLSLSRLISNTYKANAFRHANEIQSKVCHEIQYLSSNPRTRSVKFCVRLRRCLFLEINLFSCSIHSGGFRFDKIYEPFTNRSLRQYRSRSSANFFHEKIL